MQIQVHTTVHKYIQREREREREREERRRRRRRKRRKRRKGGRLYNIISDRDLVFLASPIANLSL